MSRRRGWPTTRCAARSSMRLAKGTFRATPMKCKLAVLHIRRWATISRREQPRTTIAQEIVSNTGSGTGGQRGRCGEHHRREPQGRRCECRLWDGHRQTCRRMCRLVSSPCFDRTSAAGERRGEHDGTGGDDRTDDGLADRPLRRLRLRRPPQRDPQRRARPRRRGRLPPRRRHRTQLWPRRRLQPPRTLPLWPPLPRDLRRRPTQDEHPQRPASAGLWQRLHR